MSVPNPTSVDVQVRDGRNRSNLGIIILAAALVILVLAFSVALIIAANNFSERLDTSNDTIHKLEQVVVTQQCQLEIAGDFYEGVGQAFGAPPVSPGEPNTDRAAGVAKIVAAGAKAADPNSCKPKE